MSVLRSYQLLAVIPITIAAIALALWPAAPSHARSKNSVKAAMVYNIARFVNFPGKPDNLRLCGLSKDPIAAELRALHGRKLGQARIKVYLLDHSSQISSACHLVYLHSAHPDSMGPPARGQVRIGSRKNFARHGGTIELINFGGQVRFVINDGAARKAGVSFRAQLLQLAAKVVS